MATKLGLVGTSVAVTATPARARAIGAMLELRSAVAAGSSAVAIPGRTSVAATASRMCCSSPAEIRARHPGIDRAAGHDRQQGRRERLCACRVERVPGLRMCGARNRDLSRWLRVRRCIISRCVDPWTILRRDWSDSYYCGVLRWSVLRWDLSWANGDRLRVPGERVLIVQGGDRVLLPGSWVHVACDMQGVPRAGGRRRLTSPKRLDVNRS